MGIKIGKHGSTGEVWDKKVLAKIVYLVVHIGPSREESEKGFVWWTSKQTLLRCLFL